MSTTPSGLGHFTHRPGLNKGTQETSAFSQGLWGVGSSRLGETDGLDDHHVELLHGGGEAKVVQSDRCLGSPLPLSFLALSSCSGDFICYLFSYLQSEGNKSDLNYKRMLVKSLRDRTWFLVCAEERMMGDDHYSFVSPLHPCC